MWFIMGISQPRNHSVVELNKSKTELNEWQEKLVKVGKSQDKAAFHSLFEYFAPQIKAFALSNPYSNNPAQFADELVQEVMIKIWNKASAYDATMAGANTWIFTIARNCRIDMIRKNNRQNYPLESDEMMEIEDEDGIAPFQAVQQRHLEHEIKGCFDQLPHEQAQVIAKIYLAGKTHNEVAQELNLPLGTVKSRVRLALNKLKVMVSH